LGALGVFNPGIAQRGVESAWDNVIGSQAAGDLAVYALTKAIIARESEWTPGAINPADPSYGLMQVLLSTARGIAPGITPEQLLEPITNIVIGTTYLWSRLRAYPNLADAVSAYNAGRPITANQGYVDDVLAYYAWYWSNDPVLMAASGIGDEVTPIQQIYVNTFTGEVVDPGNIFTDPITGATTDLVSGDPVLLQAPAPATTSPGVAAVLAVAAVGALLLLRR
jgi:hypothetical protein